MCSVDGTNWTAGYLSELAAAGLGSGNGYQIPVGSAAQLTTLPWVNLNQIQIVFNEDVDVTENSLVVTGLSAGQYSFAGFTYDQASHTATWTLASPIVADRIKLDLQSSGPNAVTDTSGDSAGWRVDQQREQLPVGRRRRGRRFQFRL